jgi:hypothetical protein
MKAGVVKLCAKAGTGRKMGLKNPCFRVNSRKECLGKGDS